jgi:hypothetical protein
VIRLALREGREGRGVRLVSVPDLLVADLFVGMRDISTSSPDSEPDSGSDDDASIGDRNIWCGARLEWLRVGSLKLIICRRRLSARCWITLGFSQQHLQRLQAT